MPQRRPWITTLVLVVVAVALGAFIFLWEREQTPPPAEPSTVRTPVPMWEFGTDDLVEISAAKGERRTTVARSDGEWRVTAPEEREADSTRIDSLLRQVAGLRSNDTIEGVTSLDTFGLDEPEARVTLVLSDSTTFDFTIGMENVRQTDRYVQKEGDSAVYLVSRTSLTGLLDMVDDPPYPPTPTPAPETATPEEDEETPTPTPTS